MSSSLALSNLKEDIKQLEKMFLRSKTSTSDTSFCFRLITGSVDELVCELIDSDRKKYRINANICETYPQSPPVWFSESEDTFIVDIIEKLSQTQSEDNLIINQVKCLIVEFCTVKVIAIPDLIYLFNSNNQKINNNDSGHVSPNTSDNETENDAESNENLMEEENFHENDPCTTNKEELVDGISKDNFRLLEKVKSTQRQDYLKGQNYGSTTASDRLMKELKDIFRSDNYKNKMYKIELLNDSLYEWNIELYKVDPDSNLFKDLEKLPDKKEKNHILLNFLFKDKFPFEPPFVRIIHPIIQGGYVLSGGAICMELLTKSGWSSAYCIESVILQIAATLVKGNARINFNNKDQTYSLSKAQYSFKALTQMHEKHGWYTPPPKDG
jgi:ubiquitin-conjugating enzyme E2 Q